MDTKDIISQISEKTGVSSDICKTIMKAVENFTGSPDKSGNPLGAAGAALMGKLMGGKDDGKGSTAMIDEIVKKTGISKDICEKVVKAIEDIAGKSGKDILGKINPFKK